MALAGRVAWKSVPVWQPAGTIVCYYHSFQAVALPGFVARKGKAGDYVTGHSRQTSGPGTAAAR